ncbi:GAF and ANTAR domain-containing protein [Rhodococcus fascians]|nr:GAF and ANTAR domain-containing protein [Rhodococcus fascians]MBY4059093.1 GAF and ANTAR domain-containing protein [Rhodococcus fascians]MBY4070366.1 GAF and ANTAR domain-containing protein [Rhodococcus fascians]
MTSGAVDDPTEFRATAALTHAAVDVAGVDGGAVSLLVDGAAARDVLYATDSDAVRIDELQFTIGEGPCLDAFKTGTTVAIPDLTDPAGNQNWPTFASDVVAELGVHAVMACSISAHGAAVGVLELHRREPGPYTLAQVEAARAIATALGPVILTELVPGGSARTPSPGPPAGNYRLARADINVAIGMLSTRLSVPMTDAAASLRAHAYARSTSISSIAHDIVNRTTDLEFES